MNTYAMLPDQIGFAPQADDARPDPVAALRRAWPFLIAAMLIFAALGWSFDALRTPEYVSSAEVTLQPLDGAPLSPQPRTAPELASAMNSEAASVASGQVLNIVSAKLGVRLPLGTGAISTSVVSNTYDIVIAFRAGSPELAQQGAQATAEAFLQLRSDTARTAIVQDVRTLDGELAAEARLQVKSPTLRAQLIRYASRLAALGPQLRDLRTIDTDPGTITSVPALPSGPSTTTPALYALAGAAAGLVLAVGAVIWRSRHDAYVRADSLTCVNGIPVLGVIDVGVQPANGSANDNAYGCIRTSLLARGHRAAALAVSHAGGEGGPIAAVAGDLVRSLAAASCDVTSLDLGEFRAADGSTGEDALAGPRLRTALRELAATHEFVITGADPAATQDGESVALAAGAVLLIATDGVTPVRRCRLTIARLRRLGVDVLGLAVLKGASRSTT